MNNDFIPTGDQLKDLISQPQCTAGMLNALLRERGVYCTATDKFNTVPCLITSFLSPSESIDLLSNIKTKERLEKVNFRSFQLKKEINILQDLNGKINHETLLQNEFLNYNISNFNDFTSLNGESSDEIILGFEVCRNDILDDWFTTQKFFKGSVEIKKEKTTSNGSLSLNIRLNHTTPETKEVADKISEKVEEILLSNQSIEPSAHNGRVLFDDFTNKNRVNFLYELASSHTNYLFYYKSLDDLHFNIDTELNIDTNAEKINNLLEKGIEQYRIKGKLERIISIKWHHIHPFIKATKVVASYTVSIQEKEVVYEGDCKMSFEFSDYGRKVSINPELCITFVNMKIKNASSSIVHKIESLIMREIEVKKTIFLDKLKIR